ncbi:MAG TPA: aminotransferase class V-fold PLP-dependent enzyme [Thermoanaerobaculia bacterium]|nr:aminotransferase class V-fold PLP-dependent enzyme [Thermoanaerobaculia bacterium]
MDDATLERLRREEFPVTERWAYMNHAGIAAPPRRAAERMAAAVAGASRSGDREWLDRNAEAERVRRQAARILGARDPREVAFVENTSTGLSLVAEGIDWRPGDNVVSAALEFPSNVYPWMRLMDQGVEYRLAGERDGRLDLDEIEGLIDERTRAVALSWVQYASGFRAGLRRLGAVCRERDILFIVDVIQGLGGLTLDVERDLVDVAAASGHKWLLGPEGIGLLYVSDRVVERLRPARSGWRSMRHISDWTKLEVDWNEGAKRFESGTLNVYGIHGLGGALDILLEVGPETVERRVLALAGRAARIFQERGLTLVSSRRPGETSGIVTAIPRPGGPDADALARGLAERGVVLAQRAGRLRAAPHFYNTDEEMDRLEAGLRDLV